MTSRQVFAFPIAVCIALGIAGPATAVGSAPATNVIVTNPASSPVPVTGNVGISGTSSVNVTNTPATTSGDYTQLISSGSATAGSNVVTDLFRGDLTQYKTVKLIIKCTQEPCQFVAVRVSEEFNGQSMLIDAFATPFGSDLVTVHIYDLPGSTFVVQTFNSDSSAGINFVLLGRRN